MKSAAPRSFTTKKTCVSTRKDGFSQRGLYYGSRTDLRGDVVVIQDGAKLTSDEMDIFRMKKGTNDQGSLKLGAVEKIIADGNFRYLTDENDIRGTRGVYERDKNSITVTGDVVVIQPGGNRVETQRLIYNTRSKTIRFTGQNDGDRNKICLLYTSPSPRDGLLSRMPSSA